MSEMRHGQKPELYRKWGLEELLAADTYREDPLFSNPKDHAPNSAESLVSLFGRLDLEGSPAEGYGRLAYDFSSLLSTIAKADRQTDDDNPPELIVLPVPLRTIAMNKPAELLGLKTAHQQTVYESSLSQSNLVYEFEETPVTRAYQVAISAVLHTGRAKTCPEFPNALLYPSRFYDRYSGEDVHLSLIESFEENAVGPYRTMELRNYQPIEFTRTDDIPVAKVGQENPTNLDQERARAEAASARRRIQEWNVVLDNFNSQPPKVKEAVKSRIRRDEISFRPGRISKIITDARTGRL